MNNENQQSYKFKTFRLDLTERRLLNGGVPVPLTPKAFGVLAVLVERGGHLVEKEELLERVWDAAFVEEANVARVVHTLRKTLGEDENGNKFIETVARRGYRFVAEVEEINGAGAEAPEVSVKTESPNGNQHSTAAAEVSPDLPDVTQSPTAKDKAAYKRWKWAGIILGIALIPTIVFLLVKNRGETEKVEISKTMQITTWSGLDFYPTISPDGKTVAFSSDRSGSFEIYVKQLVTGAREVQLTSDGGQNFEPAFSPDGSLIAFYSKKRRGVWVVPVTGGKPKQLTEFGSHPAFSPDGSQLAFQSDSISDLGFNAGNAFSPSTIWLVSAGGGEPKQITQVGSPPGGHGAPAFSPDGKRIVFDTNDIGAASVWSVSSQGDDLKNISGEIKNASDPVYAPDGKSLYFVTDRGSALQKINVSAAGASLGEPIKILDASGARIRQLSISADGKRILYSALSTSGDILATSLAQTGGGTSDSPVQLTQGKNTRNSAPAFSPDGRKIAFLVYSVGSSFQVWLMDADGGNKSQLTTSGGSISWFPDGKRIAFITEREKQVGLWATTVEGGVERKLFDFDGYAHFIRLSPDGKQIAFNSTRSGTINIWLAEVEGGEPKQLTFDNELAGFPAWSPDGEWLAFQLKRGEDTHVAVIPSRGGEPIQLTFDKGQSWAYSWSADGDRIFFAGQRRDVWNVYSVSRSTREVKQLTNFTKLNAYVRYPAVSPANDKIAYEYAETTGNVWMIELK